VPDFNPDEIAVLVVRGQQFYEWESVWVQVRANEPFSLFQFTAAEPEPTPDRWVALRFKPDDPCIITLGGILAMNGYIVTRQVAYDANNHGVQLLGKGITHWVAKSSVQSETGSFDKKSFEQVAREVLSYYPVGVKTIGTLDPTPFRQLQVQKGETNWDFLERIARPRKIVLGSDQFGNFLLIGDQTNDPSESLIEGVNILKCQCIITKDPMFQKYTNVGQTGASDDQYGTKASEQKESVGGSAPVFSELITPAEQPVWNAAELRKRAEAEKLWHEGAFISAEITVQGWKRPSGDLWRPLEVVQVISPMAILNDPLGIHTVTFTQDSRGGTLTTLSLVRPELLNMATKYVNPDFPTPGPTDAPATPQANSVQPNLPPDTKVGPNGIEPNASVEIGDVEIQ
jgi:prophage tail gpP-like protein